MKGLFNDEGLATRGGGGGGSNGRGGDNNGPHHSGNNSAWSSSSPPQQHHNDNQKKEAESSSSGGAGRLLDRRDSSSPVPSGRIAVTPLESPLSAHHSLPLFPQPAAAYPRGPPFSSLPPALYQTFTGFQRPDSANSKTTTSATPTPSSVMSFGGGSKSELPSPSHTPSGGGGRDSTNNSAYKFSPRRGIERDGGGGGSDLYDAVGKQEQLRRASPSSLRRSSSEAFGERCAPSPQPRSAKQLMSSDSTTGGGGGGDPSQSPSGRRGGFANEPDRLRLKTEMPGSPVERKRTFSGEFSAASRDSLSHLSSSSGLPLTRAEAEGKRKFLYGNRYAMYPT